ncbi:hypothetical protein P3S67_018077 [Capsicum chacoense]
MGKRARAPSQKAIMAQETATLLRGKGKGHTQAQRPSVGRDLRQEITGTSESTRAKGSAQGTSIGVEK